MTIYTATANGQTFRLTDTDDTVDLAGFSDIVADSDQSNGHSNTTFNLGNGTSNDVVAFVGDTVIGGGAGSNDTIRGAGSDNLYQLGDGTFSVALSLNDTLIAGNGDDSINVASGSSAQFISLGNGDDTIAGVRSSGNFTIDVGTGNDSIDLARHSSGNLVFTQALGAAPATIDLTSAALTSFTATISNNADVLELGDAHISNFVIDVAVDGFKLPDGDGPSQGYRSSPTANTVNYIATDEEIAAPYNVAQPLPYFIDKLLFSPTPHWNTDLGQAVTLNFSFMQALPSYASHGQGSDATGFRSLGANVPVGLSPSQLLTDNLSHSDGVSLTAAQLSAVTALAAWEKIANVDFVSVLDSNSPTDEVRIGSNNQGDESGGYSYVPFPDMTVNDELEAADVYINNDSAIEPLSDYGRVFIHEFGHVLGLGGESGDSDPYDILPGGAFENGGGEDSALYTIMSYDNPPAGRSAAVTTPQVFDIAVAQYLYGADPNFDANPSHVWTFSSTYGSTGNLIDGAGGTSDLIAAGTGSATAYIDLRPGHWSWLGQKSTDILAANQLFIDYGTEIDGADASGAGGAATIVCNDNDDVIVCGSGTDLIVVGAGLDSILGNVGNDTVLFQSNRADYGIVDDGNGVYTVTANDSSVGGTDVLTNITNLEFSDQTISNFAPLDFGNLTATQMASLSAAAIANLTTTQVAELSLTAIDGLSTSRIAAMSGAQIAAMSATQFNELTTTQFASIRPAALSAMSVTNLADLSPTRLAAITTTQLLNMSVAALGELTWTQVAELSTSQLAGLNAAALHALGATNLDAMTSTQLASLTATQFLGFNASAIAGLSTTEITAFTKTRIAALSTTQASALTVSQLAVLTAAQLGGLTTADMVALTTTQIGGLSAGQFAAFSTTQMTALSTSGIAALTQTQIYGLTTGDIAAVTVTQVPQLSLTALPGLSVDQIMAFTPAQIGAMTPDQYAAILG